VLDYKTGSNQKYKKLSETNPIAHGQFLQLPLYALAARAAGLCSGDALIRSDFWFISKVVEKPKGYPVTDDILQATGQAFAVVVDAHRAGLFPPRPKAHSNGYDCATCNADGLEERQTSQVFETLLADPQLAEYAAVIADVK